MPKQTETVVRIEKDGRQAAVTEHDYRHKKLGALKGQTYEEAGYSVVAYEDGTPYGGDATPTKYAVNAAGSALGIGDKPSGTITTIDGDKAPDDLVRAAGVAVPEVKRSTPTRRSEPSADVAAPPSS